MVTPRPWRMRSSMAWERLQVVTVELLVDLLLRLGYVCLQS